MALVDQQVRLEEKEEEARVAFWSTRLTKEELEETKQLTWNSLKFSSLSLTEYGEEELVGINLRAEDVTAKAVLLFTANKQLSNLPGLSLSPKSLEREI